MDKTDEDSGNGGLRVNLHIVTLVQKLDQCIIRSLIFSSCSKCPYMAKRVIVFGAAVTWILFTSTYQQTCRRQVGSRWLVYYHVTNKWKKDWWQWWPLREFSHLLGRKKNCFSKIKIVLSRWPLNKVNMIYSKIPLNRTPSGP